jgi:hypothetical protein
MMEEIKALGVEMIKKRNQRINKELITVPMNMMIF